MVYQFSSLVLEGIWWQLECNYVINYGYYVWNLLVSFAADQANILDNPVPLGIDENRKEQTRIYDCTYKVGMKTNELRLWSLNGKEWQTCSQVLLRLFSRLKTMEDRLIKLHFFLVVVRFALGLQCYCFEQISYFFLSICSTYSSCFSLFLKCY